MILVRHIVDLVSKNEKSEALENHGSRVCDYAPDGVEICLWNDLKITPNDPEWFDFPFDEDTLTFVDTHGKKAVDKIIDIAKKVPFTIFDGFGGLLYDPDPKAPSVKNAEISTDTGGGEGGTYSFGGIAPRRTNGLPIPLVFGEHLVGGVIIQEYFTATDDQNEEYHAIIALSEGPVESIGQYTTAQDHLTGNDLPDGLRFNGEDAKAIRRADISLRLGISGEDILPGAQETVTGYNDIGFELKTPFPRGGTYDWVNRTSVYVHKCEKNPDAVQVVFQWPRGFFRNDTPSGTLTTIGSRTIIEIRGEGVDETDPGTLVQRIETIHGGRKQSPVTEDVRLDNLKAKKVDAGLGANDPIYIHVYRGHPYRPEYEYNQYRMDLIQVKSINEIKYVGLEYRHIAKIEVNIVANEAMNGSIPLTQTLTKGINDIWTGATSEYTTNTAWIARHLLINKRYGLGALIESDDTPASLWTTAAAKCDELVETYTGSGVFAKRHTFNGVIDERVPGFERVLQILATARMTLINSGATYKPKIETQRSATQVFTRSNIKSLEISYNSKRTAKNIVEVEFLSSDLDYKHDMAQAAWYDVEQPDQREQKNTVQYFGITTLQEAMRMAWYILRLQRLPERRITITTGLDAIAVEPGDVFKYGSHTDGRISAYDGSSITLDKDVEFISGINYVYTEVDSDGTFNTYTFNQSGTSDTLPFAPLSSGNAVGRPWRIHQENIEDTEWVVEEITGAGPQATERTIIGLEYVAACYGDDAGPSKGGYFSPAPGTTPAAVTDLAVTESFSDIGVSEMALTWTNPASTAYLIIWEKHTVPGDVGGLGTNGESNYKVIGTVSDPTAALDWLCRLDLGTRITFAVQAVGSKGDRLDLDDCATVNIIVGRDDVGETIAVYPAKVGTITQTQDALEVYTLSWGAVAGAELYEGRLGAWNDGPTVFSTSGTSVTIRVNSLARKLIVRAKIGNFYSPAAREVTLETQPYQDYTTQVAGFGESFDPGRGSNCHLGVLPRGGGLTYLVQSLRAFGDDDAPMSYRTQVADAGATRVHHIATDIRIFSYVSVAAISYQGGYHVSTRGEINTRYLTYNIYLEYSDDASTWSSRDITSDVGSAVGIILQEARYYRLYLVLSSPRIGEEPGSMGLPVYAALEKIDFEVYRQ